MTLKIVGIGHIVSFKNRKRAILDSHTGKMRTLTPYMVKKRMDNLENAILSALYSSFPTEGTETPLECLKQLQIALSGLSDDSVNEIPCGMWESEQVISGEEGCIIQVFELTEK